MAQLRSSEDDGPQYGIWEVPSARQQPTQPPASAPTTEQSENADWYLVLAVMSVIVALVYVVLRWGNAVITALRNFF